MVIKFNSEKKSLTAQVLEKQKNIGHIAGGDSILIKGLPSNTDLLKGFDVEFKNAVTASQGNKEGAQTRWADGSVTTMKDPKNKEQQEVTLTAYRTKMLNTLKDVMKDIPDGAETLSYGLGASFTVNAQFNRLLANQTGAKNNAKFTQSTGDTIEFIKSMKEDKKKVLFLTTLSGKSVEFDMVVEALKDLSPEAQKRVILFRGETMNKESKIYQYANKTGDFENRTGDIIKQLEFDGGFAGGRQGAVGLATIPIGFNKAWYERLNAAKFAEDEQKVREMMFGENSLPNLLLDFYQQVYDKHSDITIVLGTENEELLSAFSQLITQFQIEQLGNGTNQKKPLGINIINNLAGHSFNKNTPFIYIDLSNLEGKNIGYTYDHLYTLELLKNKAEQHNVPAMFIMPNGETKDLYPHILSQMIPHFMLRTTHYLDIPLVDGVSQSNLAKHKAGFQWAVLQNRYNKTIQALVNNNVKDGDGDDKK